MRTTVSQKTAPISLFSHICITFPPNAEYTKLFANPYNAAKYGYIDDVIEPRNTRFRIIRALAQLENKKLTNPAKKHGNIPL